MLRNGSNMRSNFISALDAVKNIGWDLVVLTGDIAFDVFDNDYEWVKSKLKGLNYFVIPGNHDVSQIMAEHFDLNKFMTGDKIFYKISVKGKDFLFVDTSQEWLDLSILERMIDRKSGKGNTFVFMHHPPSLCSAKHMDTYYPLGNHIEATEFFNRCEQIEHIFCGHYHTAHCFKNKNFTIHIGPSTWYQIGRKLKKFNILHSRPGWTLIDIDDRVSVKNFFL